MKNIALVFILLFAFNANAQNLKIMSYNIRLDVAVDGDNGWNHRKGFLTSQIQFYAPDILGIQEALPNQVADLENTLRNYDHVGIGRDGEGKGEASAIFYDKARFQMKETHTFWLSETPDRVSKGWDASYIRICTYVLLKDKKTKRTFWVFNTHLDNSGVVARTKGVALILVKIKEVNLKNHPVIFMGDFNSEPGSDLWINLKKVMTDSRDVSEAKPFGPSGTFNGFKFNEPVTRLIDYIFISDPSRMIVKKHAVLSDSNNLRYPSDHLPVYVEVLLNGK
ncbi:MAG TPA: endonuclease/exonuclease/phosphatase family protein [Pyrinomonadaceae bacterium]|nr:endonuclease/exonuclease/phosphatase family protein [Pyrinomonadaceae bacterium]